MPLIWYAVDSLNDISKKLAPIGSVKYVHKRTEDKRKFEVVDESNTRMSPDLQLVCDYINNKGDTHKVMPPKKKLRTTTSRMPSELLKCPIASMMSSSYHYLSMVMSIGNLKS